ncbi:MAG: DUF1015 domain-containing protein [Chloroflexi bacterium]|nr:DUF1015 domain-containing protein [Chloroflexota bacterium]
MAEIRPFKGLRYSPDFADSMDQVTAPPYDVISPEQQRALYARSEHNVIRLEFGLEFEGDSPPDNRYTRARELFEQWLRDGVLVADRKPSMYLYQHEFEFRGSRRARRGVMAGLRLEDPDSGIVLPHEDTLDKPLGDRLDLMRACHANFSPVFGLFEDKNAHVAGLLEAVAASTPVIKVNGSGGEAHTVWIVEEPALLRALAEAIAPSPVFIADGHHRYKTALRYRDEVRAANPRFTGDEAYNYVMALLVELSDPGLVILPTHRVVARDLSDSACPIEQKLSDLFEVQHFPANGDPGATAGRILQHMESAGSASVFGVYGLREGHFSLLLARNDDGIRDAMPRTSSAAWRSLDVSVLKAVVLERALGISEEDLVREGGIEYVADEVAAVRAVGEGKASLAWFLRPATVQQVRDVALASDRMPRKSTYFHPKPLTGLVLNHLEGDLPRLA